MNESVFVFVVVVLCILFVVVVVVIVIVAAAGVCSLFGLHKYSVFSDRQQQQQQHTKRERDTVPAIKWTDRVSVCLSIHTLIYHPPTECVVLWVPESIVIVFFFNKWSEHTSLAVECWMMAVSDTVQYSTVYALYNVLVVVTSSHPFVCFAARIQS
jgi:hypothetical protein